MPKPTTTTEFVTPAQARRMRARAVDRQRRISEEHVREIVRTIETGEWHPYTAAPVCEGVDGDLYNGNHRLEAITRLPAGTRVPLLISRNVPEAALPHIDGGRNRSLADHMKFGGVGLSDLSGAAALSKVLVAYRGPGYPVIVNQKIETKVAIEHVLANEARYERVLADAKRISKADAIDVLTGQHFVGAIATPRTLGWLLWHIDGFLYADAVTFFEDHANRRYTATSASQRLVKHFSKPEQQFKTGSEAASQAITRMANLSLLWETHLLGRRRFTAWDEKADTFPHPVGDHVVRKAVSKRRLSAVS